MNILITLNPILGMFIMVVECESEDVFYHTLLLLNYCQFKETKTFSSFDHFTLITLA